jgi:Flp pilus assembly protein TadG
MTAFLASFRATLDRLTGDRRGNVAMIWALAGVVSMGIIGLSIDFSRANTARAALQNAVDAAGLAIGAKPGLTQPQREALAATYLRENFSLDSSMGTPVLTGVVANANDVVVSARIDVPTTLGALFAPKLSPNASSRVVWGQTKLWVSLALDNTGSMAGTKLTALKTATHQLLTMLDNVEVQPGDIEVSLIPFSKTVNVGTTNVSAPWIDWTDWEAPPANHSIVANDTWADYGPQGRRTNCPWTSGNNGYVCMRAAPNGSTNYSSSATVTGGLFCPSVDSGSRNAGRASRHYNGCFNSVKRVASCTSNCKYDHTWIPNARSTWTGCIMDRTQSHDVNMTVPTSAATRFPAENSASCVPVPMLGSLNHDWAALHAKTDAMTAVGNTNQTIGLAWAMMAQNNSQPLSAPSLPEFTTRYIILFSDGQNTQNRWSSTQSAVDARMTLACNNAKDAGFVVYSIFVETGGGAANSAVMQACASDASKYYALTTAGAIVTAFNQIGQEITKLRVAN